MPPVLGADPSAALPVLQGLARLWPLWLPLVVGGLAVFWLLPRPQPRRTRDGEYAAAVAGAVLGAIVVLWDSFGRSTASVTMGEKLIWTSLGAIGGGLLGLLLYWVASWQPRLSTCVGLGVMALALGGRFLVHTGTISIETLLFYCFSALAIVFGVMLVTQQNPARAALSFAVVVLSTCGLFLLLAAPFLMAATIIVYAGAIVVTFLFVLMLAQQEGLSSADARSREPLLSTLTGFVLLGALLYVLQLGYDTRELDTLLSRVREALAAQDTDTVRKLVDPTVREDAPEKGGDDLFGQGERILAAHGMRDRAEKLAFEWSFLTPDEKLDALRKPLEKLEALVVEAREHVGTVQPAPGTPLSSLSGTPANTPHAQVRRSSETNLPELPAENSAYLGRSLFTDFLLPVELGGTLLLVAAIGAIAIGQRRPAVGGQESGVRGQESARPDS
jgi:NADH:ubiquinone oxidoreductase subunit 6 (subunit J)